MRAGFSEALTLVGYVLGGAVTPVVGGWASGWVGGQVLDDTVLMCVALFEVAFLLGMVRAGLRGARWLARASAGRRRAAEAPDVSP